MKNMRKILVLLFVVALAVANVLLAPNVLPVKAAESGTCRGGISWTLNDNGVLTISGNGSMDQSSWPWRSFTSSIKTVVIHEGVTSIGNWAFQDCSSLTSITIPNGVTSIGSSAFSGCSSLTSITIPDSVTSIESSAFYRCSSLTSITIPDSVTSMESSAFSRCSSLTGIYVSKGNPFYSSDAFGVLFNKNKTELIKAPGGITGSYAIPNSVTSIKSSAFSDCSGLTSVTIPNSVANFESFVFSYCSGLTSVTISNGVTSIGSSAFYGCSSLTSITIPNSVTSIGSSAFSGCSSLISITIPNSVSSIGDCAFFVCRSLVSISIPNSVTSIGGSTFDGCGSLISISIPSSVTSIGGFAFFGCDKLGHVAYGGTETQWKNISIASGNYALSSVCYKAEMVLTEGCPADGVYCTGCEQDIIKAAGKHSYTGKVTNPTLTGHGYTTYTCKVCGDSYRANYTFPDVPSSLWSYNAIEFAVAKGYFSGYQSGKFGPTDNITRQDFVVVLARLAKVDLSKYSGRTGFPDVKAGSYYEKAVKWASSNGIVSGYNNGKFGVGDKITREQLVTILYNYAKKMGYNTSVPSNAVAKLSAYTDAYKITGYAKPAVIWALNKGIISGMTATTVAPQNNASRGQVATILMNISKKGIMPI